MSDISFDVTTFRAQFPAFSSNANYPDLMIRGYWDAACCYISSEDYGDLAGAQRQRALNLMTAHMTAISDRIASGESLGVQTGAKVDKISITIAPPPARDAFQYWLQTTPYGMQLIALLQAKSAGGWYIGGLPERAAFRKTYGVF